MYVHPQAASVHFQFDLSLNTNDGELQILRSGNEQKEFMHKTDTTQRKIARAKKKKSRKHERRVLSIKRQVITERFALWLGRKLQRPKMEKKKKMRNKPTSVHRVFTSLFLSFTAHTSYQMHCYQRVVCVRLWIPMTMTTMTMMTIQRRAVFKLSANFEFLHTQHAAQHFCATIKFVYF